MKGQIRQGEILLIPVGNDPNGLKETPVKTALLGIGETGNAHVVEGVGLQWLHDAVEDINKVNSSGAAVARCNIYLKVGSDSQISHRATDEPHGTLALPAGTYLIRVDREWLPFEDEARFVAD